MAVVGAHAIISANMFTETPKMELHMRRDMMNESIDQIECCWFTSKVNHRVAM
jgi:hypothetical protein